MKILSINSNDIYGGAARAAYRLHNGLIDLGIDSTYLVKNKNSNLESVITITDNKYKLKSKINNRLNKHKLKKYKERQNIIYSVDLFSTNIHKIINKMDVDLVHLHWVNGFIDVKSIGKIDKPIVWTLHDMWPFTGGCHYDQNCGNYKSECGNCPLLNSHKNKDLSRKVFNKKIKAYKNIKKLTIVGLSKWIADCAKQSKLFKNLRVENLPNPIDIKEFNPVDKKNARAILNLPVNKKIILFGAMSADSDKRKGYKYLIEALKNISITKDEIEIVIFGYKKNEIKNEYGIKTKYVGSFADNISLKILYSAADVMISPSVQENLSNMIMESMSCGTPVVAFNIGGNPDMIDHKQIGYLTEPFNTNDLAKGIDWILEDNERRKALSLNARQKVLENFDSKIVIPKYIELYKDILNIND